MARTPNPPDPIESLPMETRLAIARITQAETDDRDMLNQVMGQATMANAFSKFVNVAFLSKLLLIKERKLYRALAPKTGNLLPKNLDAIEEEAAEKVVSDTENPPHTWAGFCQLLGFSREKIDQDLANLKAFGEEALEHLGRVGVGYRELRKLRRLPDETRQTILDMAETAEKDDLVQMVDDVVAKFEDAKKRVEDLEADLRAKDQVLEQKGKRLDEVSAEVLKARRLIQDMSKDEILKKLQGETHEAFYSALGRVRQLDRCITALLEHAHRHLDVGVYEISDFVVGLLCQIDTNLGIIRKRHGLGLQPTGQVPSLSQEYDPAKDPVAREQMRQSWEEADPEQRKLHAALYAQFGFSVDGPAE